MAYIINPGIYNVRGVITTAEINALASTPFVFQTPDNFTPIGFNLTATSGTTQPTFTAPLGVFTVSSLRPFFIGTDPANVGFYTFFGFVLNNLAVTPYSEAINIELTANNFQLTPSDFVDPIPGDYEYLYNFYGYVL